MGCYHHLCYYNLHECLSSGQSSSNPQDRPANRCVINGKVVIEHSPGLSGPGKSASVQIYSSTEIDPNTRKGKLSRKAGLKQGKSIKKDGTKITSYKIKLHVEPGFGNPGAFVIENNHKHRFFLQSATLQTPENNKVFHFDCRSWVYPIRRTQTARVFFANTCYLPRQTPAGLVELRKEELQTLRGDGTGERQEWVRIYDYDVYNDLANTEEGSDHVKPILGGSDSHPYPRRLRTGCPGSKNETIDLNTYVPPDERCSPKKLSEFMSSSMHATAHFLLPEAKSFSHDASSFESFDEIRDLYSDDRCAVMKGMVTTEKMKKLVPVKLFKEITPSSKEDHIKFPLPQIISANELAWGLDEEFGRQMLAGTNPTRIECLREFPPQGRLGYSFIGRSDIEHNLDGLSVEQAMNQCRIYILDHHDYLLPLLRKMNSEGVCPCASRTLLFLRNDATLRPLAIELCYPDSFHSEGMVSRVILPAKKGTSRALWQLARAHVVANDSAYHQLISHWLHTHAVVEPFIIATRRQLSVMHPVHRLLDPHFKDTLHINALFRSILLKSGGILEKTLFTGKFSMELSSELYKEWRFDEQALPVDLLKRYMALEDPESPTEVHIPCQDYPYALDGLDVWLAIKTWVGGFCDIFYEDDESVKSDTEIQAWWSEIRNVGHADKRNERWWYQLTTKTDLKQTLTTLIWIASALHASVNFGHYAYAGYPPNRPTRCRKFVPEEGTMEFAEFLKDPDKYFLNMLPNRFQATLGIALMEVLSRHTSNELYLGQKPTSEWIDNNEVKEKFEVFSNSLQEIEKKVLERNQDPKLKNRRGPAKIPYRIFYPNATKVEPRTGIPAKGIPNSVSI